MSDRAADGGRVNIAHVIALLQRKQRDRVYRRQSKQLRGLEQTSPASYKLRLLLDESTDPEPSVSGTALYELGCLFAAHSRASPSIRRAARGYFDQAIEPLTQDASVEENPDRGRAALRLARAHRELFEPHDAASWFRAASKTLPQDLALEALMELGSVCADALADWGAASDAFSKAAALARRIRTRRASLYAIEAQDRLWLMEHEDVTPDDPLAELLGDAELRDRAWVKTNRAPWADSAALNPTVARRLLEEDLADARSPREEFKAYSRLVDLHRGDVAEDGTVHESFLTKCLQGTAHARMASIVENDFLRLGPRGLRGVAFDVHDPMMTRRRELFVAWHRVLAREWLVMARRSPNSEIRAAAQRVLGNLDTRVSDPAAAVPPPLTFAGGGLR